MNGYICSHSINYLFKPFHLHIIEKFVFHIVIEPNVWQGLIKAVQRDKACNSVIVKGQMDTFA